MASFQVATFDRFWNRRGPIDSVGIKWIALDGVVGYRVTWRPAGSAAAGWSGPEVVGASCDGTVVSGLEPGRRFVFRVTPVFQDKEEEEEEEESEVESWELEATPLDPVESVRVDDTDGRFVRFCWEPVEGAGAYRVQQIGGESRQPLQIGGASHTVGGLSSGKEVALRVWVGAADNHEGEWVMRRRAARVGGRALVPCAGSLATTPPCPQPRSGGIPSWEPRVLKSPPDPLGKRASFRWLGTLPSRQARW